MLTKVVKCSAAISAIAGVALLSACATHVSPSDPVYHRIAQLQHQVDQLQKLVKGSQFMGVVSDQQQLQNRLSSLQGQIQTLHHQLQQTRKRQQSVNRNFNQRLVRLGGGAPAGMTSGAASGVVSKVPGSSATSSQGAQGSGAATGTSTQSVSDHTAYRAAFNKLRAGHNTAALKAFKSFIKDYPKSSLVPNAWYWMAETHYVNGEYKQAIGNFREVIKNYPNSAKTPNAFLKVGYAQYALGEYSKARSTFKAVMSKYPGTTAADLHRDNGALEIAVMNLATGNMKVLTHGPLDRSPTFAPNGTMILYDSLSKDGGRVLATVSVDSKVREELSGTHGGLSQPAWGPFPPHPAVEPAPAGTAPVASSSGQAF